MLLAAPGAAGQRGGAGAPPPSFGDGGAFPECHVIQHPLGMGRGRLGPGGLPPRLDIDYSTLQARGPALMNGTTLHAWR
jgi:hypothetical protein